VNNKEADRNLFYIHPSRYRNKVCKIIPNITEIEIKKKMRNIVQSKNVIG